MAIINKKVTTQAQTQFHVGTDGNLVMAMGSDGKVNIGATSGTGLLNVDGGTGEGSLYVEGTFSGAPITARLLASDGGAVFFGSSTNHDVRIQTNGSNKLIVNSSGIVTVGTSTTDPVSGAYAGTTSAMVVDSDLVHTSAASANQTLTLKGNNDYMKLCLLGDSTYEANQIRWFSSDGGTYTAFIDVRNSASFGMTFGSALNSGVLRFTARNSDGSGGQVEKVRISEHGMTFNGDTAAANALDDYEEGTWTASIVSSTAGSVTFNQGYYTKIGNMVFANFQLTVNSQASGNNYIVMPGPFVQHINNLTWVGYLTNYPYGDRRSGIIVNNSSGNNTDWYLSWSSNSTASTTIRGVMVYQTT